MQLKTQLGPARLFQEAAAANPWVTGLSLHLGVWATGLLMASRFASENHSLSGWGWDTFQKNWGPHYDDKTNFGAEGSFFFLIQKIPKNKKGCPPAACDGKLLRWCWASSSLVLLESSVAPIELIFYKIHPKISRTAATCSVVKLSSSTYHECYWIFLNTISTDLFANASFSEDFQMYQAGLKQFWYGFHLKSMQDGTFGAIIFSFFMYSSTTWHYGVVEFSGEVNRKQHLITFDSDGFSQRE